MRLCRAERVALILQRAGRLCAHQLLKLTAFAIHVVSYLQVGSQVVSHECSLVMCLVYAKSSDTASDLAHPAHRQALCAHGAPLRSTRCTGARVQPKASEAHVQHTSSYTGQIDPTLTLYIS